MSYEEEVKYLKRQIEDLKEEIKKLKYHWHEVEGCQTGYNKYR